MKETAPKPPCWALKSNQRPFFEIFVELPTRQPSPSGVTGLPRMAPPMSGSCESSRAISAAERLVWLIPRLADGGQRSPSGLIAGCPSRQLADAADPFSLRAAARHRARAAVARDLSVGGQCDALGERSADLGEDGKFNRLAQMLPPALQQLERRRELAGIRCAQWWAMRVLRSNSTSPSAPMAAHTLVADFDSGAHGA